MEMHFYFVAGAELTPDIETARETLLAWWRHLNAEDEGICELLQLGLPFTHKSFHSARSAFRSRHILA